MQLGDLMEVELGVGGEDFLKLVMSAPHAVGVEVFEQFVSVFQDDVRILAVDSSLWVFIDFCLFAVQQGQ